VKKVFRLFISSTFSDFENERELLQSTVFPKLTQYCEDAGYQFQPIDLRWGVQAEAQLDQKTLEVCLNQVKACKHFPHPNFLIMVGERYGWVPLPYAIEQKEFLHIRKYAKKIDARIAREKEKNNIEETVGSAIQTTKLQLIDQWYRHDKNYLYETDLGYSTAYVLGARTDDCISPQIWASVEEELRNLLQDAAKSLRLVGKERDKYFLSATEHEVIEGIFEYQSSYNNVREWGDRADSEYVYGFIRGKDKENIDENVRVFRSSLRKALPSTNIFESDTSGNYCVAFCESLFGFLKQCVDRHITTVSEIPLLVQEISEQGIYLAQKIANFSGRENTLAVVDDYVGGLGAYPDQPLVIFGPSGIGKSSVMAKLVERSRTKGYRVVFRFVGATPGSSSSRSLLTSLCQECAHFQPDSSDSSFVDEGEPFNEFSLRVSRFLGGMRRQILIVIDALDQLANSDELLWLPERLPANLKVILSVLNDPNYREDSRYFMLLDRRIKNLYELPKLPNVSTLLDELLASRKRTLQPRQRNYVLKQYSKTCTPLFLKIIMEEIVNWKSYEGHKFLGNDQREAIAAFIGNLSRYYHHHPEFVDRVLGYILASDEGITESELISAISSNPTLLQRLAPDTFHTNASRKLPMAIWARLHFQLQNFLVTKFSEGYGLLSFFHREFRDATKNVVSFRSIHSEFIEQLKKIIVENQCKPFSVTRWGKLFALSTTLYSIQEEEGQKSDFAAFICELDDSEWIDEYVRFVESRGDFYNQHSQMARALTYNRHSFDLIDILYRRDHQSWMPARIRSLIGLAGTYYNLNRLNEASGLEIQAVEILDSLSIHAPDKTDQTVLKLLVQTLLNHSATQEKLNLTASSLQCKEKAYQALQDQLLNPEFDDLRLKCLIELSYHYAEHLDNKTKALVLSGKALDLSRQLKTENEAKYIKYYVATLVNTAIWFDKVESSIAYEQEALEIVGRLIKLNRALWVMHYATCLNNLAFSYEKEKRIDEAEAIFKDVLEEVKERHQVEPDRWTRAYAKSLTNIAQFYLNQGQIEQAISNFGEAFSIIKMKYLEDQNDWADQYLKKGMNLAEAYRVSCDFKKCVSLQTEALSVVERLQATNEEKWGEAYAHILNKTIETCKVLKLKQRLQVLSKNARLPHSSGRPWNDFYKKNPIVISTVFLNR
jgi:tetratricopeptide (TPR) repeat protein